MIYFLIPVYNEAENIPNLFRELETILPGKEKLFVFSDDGSKDNSAQLIAEQFKTLPHHILSDGINGGPGSAFNKGFEWILQDSNSDTDVVITLEADSTSDISLAPKMLAIHQLGYDLVLASVYAQGGGFDKTSFFRKFVSSVANLGFRFLFDVKVLTISSFYRLYGVSLLRKIKANNSAIISERGFICMLEILVKAIYQNAAIVEIPMVLHSKKRIGRSKMKITKTTWEYLKFFMKSKRSIRQNA